MVTQPAGPFSTRVAQSPLSIRPLLKVQPGFVGHDDGKWGSSVGERTACD